VVTCVAATLLLTVGWDMGGAATRKAYRATFELGGACPDEVQQDLESLQRRPVVLCTGRRDLELRPR
jgi:hypothetical protein